MNGNRQSFFGNISIFKQLFKLPEL